MQPKQQQLQNFTYYDVVMYASEYITYKKGL